MKYYQDVILILEYILAHFIANSNGNGTNNKFDYCTNNKCDYEAKNNYEYETFETIVIYDFEQSATLI